MKKLVGRIIGFVVFAGVFLCAAGGILAVATGLVDVRALLPGLPELPEIDTGRFPLPDPELPLPEIELPEQLQPGEQVALNEHVYRRPLVARIPAPQQIVTAPQVLGTNFMLAVVMALLFGATSTVMGNMLRDEEPRIRAWLHALKIDKAFDWVVKAARWGMGKATVKRTFLTLPLVLIIFALYGIIFAFLEQGTSIFSREGAFLAVSMAFSVGLVSFGGDIARRIAGRIWRTKSRFCVYPINLLTAAGTVILSRGLRLSPGIAFGTPGGADVDLPEDKREKRELTLSLLSLGILAVLGTLGWAISAGILYLLEMPLDSRLIPTASALLTAVQNTSLLLFMVALETSFFEMLPTAYSLGQSIFKKSKILWGLLFLPMAFLFNHTLLNPQSGFLDSFQVSNVRFLWFVLFLLVGITAALWFYFNIVDDVLKDWLGVRPAPSPGKDV